MRCLSEHKKTKEKCGSSFFPSGDGGWVGGWEIIFFAGDESNVYILEINAYIFCGCGCGIGGGYGYEMSCDFVEFI